MTPDEQETLSIAYCTARIVRLTSGAYALLSPYTSGSEIIHIGPWDSLADLVPSYDELASWHEAESPRYHTEEDHAAGQSLLSKLGLAKPKEPFERRI